MKQVYNNFEQFIRTLSLFFLFFLCGFANNEDVKVVDKVVYSKEKKQEIDDTSNFESSWEVFNSLL